MLLFLPLTNALRWKGYTYGPTRAARSKCQIHLTPHHSPSVNKDDALQIMFAVVKAADTIAGKCRASKMQTLRILPFIDPLPPMKTVVIYRRKLLQLAQSLAKSESSTGLLRLFSLKNFQVAWHLSWWKVDAREHPPVIGIGDFATTRVTDISGGCRNGKEQN